MLRDADSTGGTQVRNAQITEHELVLGDVFRIGDTEIRYSSDHAQDQSTGGSDTIFGRPKPKPKVKPVNFASQ